MTTPDYYEILQVHPRADEAAIDAAYKRLLDLYDPARLSGAADELVAIARGKRAALDEAYAVLCDPARRAAYDAARAEGGEPTIADGAVATAAADAPSSLAAGQPQETLDYRPLPPAQRSERPRGFRDQPAAPAPGRPGVGGGISALIIAAAVVLPALVVSLLLTGGGAVPTTPAATATPSPADQFEALIAEARRFTEQNPGDARAWIDYGNLLYDSAQIVREQAPDSLLYQQRLPRWLEAIAAYERALEIDPSNFAVQGDKGASACFYGAGAGDAAYLDEGLAETQRALEAAPDDARVLLSHGYCLVSAQPPQTEQAVEEWRRVIEIVPEDSPLAGQAQLLIEQYSGQ